MGNLCSSYDQRLHSAVMDQFEKTYVGETARINRENINYENHENYTTQKTYSNGNVYMGETNRENKRHGLGVCIFRNSRISIIGSWKNDVMVYGFAIFGNDSYSNENKNDDKCEMEGCEGYGSHVCHDGNITVVNMWEKIQQNDTTKLNR